MGSFPRECNGKEARASKETFALIFPAIAKISTCEIRLPNFHEIKYVQKLGIIRYICMG